MSISRVSTPQLRELVYDQLTRALMLGEFKPGDSFTITSLAEQVGTSVVPVREAMQRLSAEGAIELLPGRSARIPALSLEAFEELTMVRLMLEGKAAALAAERISPKGIAEVAAHNRRIVAAIARDDVAVMMAENKRFHFAIYRAAGAPTLERLIEMMWLRAGPFMASSFRDPDSGLTQYRKAEEHHVRIVAALEAGAAEATGLAVQEDIRRFADQYRLQYYDGAAPSVAAG